ncbi:MAG: DNA mismatch repair endonuclease MutL, partial [Anaerolineaceae bacterium]|nr:DNA mismatch repair endonuclease MutL [Anaerolineaceae bacterium]
MPIHILPDHIASQIAAGEVVERPASVVKELIENAIDAGAKHIVVTINGCGQRLIEVADDGAGISEKEIPLALVRHATSKLETTEDLFNINTLGFRGEALASIGSVSRLTLTSSNGLGDTGARMRMEGGRPEKLAQVGVPKGTVIRVEDLFYNVPARLKFLKSETTEKNHIYAFIARYAIAYPDMRWEYIQDGRVVLQTSGNGDRREILTNLYGVDEAKQMINLEFVEGDISINGFISPIALTRSSRREITIFVKGRWIQDASLTAAIIKAYHTMLMVGRYPMAILFIDLPASAVDVNVHPAKAEVRFREGARVFSEVQRAVRRALLATSPVPMLQTSTLWGSQNRQIDPAWQMSRDQTDPESPLLPFQNSNADLQNPKRIAGLPLLRLIGQVASTYLVAEGPDGLYLIDQHAAHERVLFEQLIAQVSAKSIPSQTLIDPPVVQLSEDKAKIIEGQLELLSKLGFGIEEFGLNTFIIREIPAIISKGNPMNALTALVEAFEEDETPLQ